jgi:hypothetical protein
VVSFRYLKGRLTYGQVNSAIDQIHQVLATKYKILNTKRLGMGEHLMKKYRVMTHLYNIDFVTKHLLIVSCLEDDLQGKL